MSEFTTSPLWQYANYAILGLMLYAGSVGVLLTLIPEGTKAHAWVQRILLPSALSVVAFFCAFAILSGGMVGFYIARSLL